MKIGIITFWESNDNYGQQLQCWALQHYLRNKGLEPFLIRQYVWPPEKKGVKAVKQFIKDKTANFLYSTHLAYLPGVYKYFKFCLDREACRRKFPMFRRKHLKMTRIYNSASKLQKNPPKADVYITGSDQVWNYTMPPSSLKNYFLQFGEASTKRIAYAPSIAHADVPEGIKVLFKDYLKSFSAISVRETSAVPLIMDLGYDVCAVLDPSMLLLGEDYLQMAGGAESKQNVFIYSMNYKSADGIPFEDIKRYAHDNSLPIIVTPGSGYEKGKELFSDVEYSYATVQEWIHNMANAELVVTASFHGIVFAILLHSPFIYTPLKGELSSGNNRVQDLLNILGLENRIWKDDASFENCVTADIDWRTVDKRLDDLRTESVNFLMNALHK